MYTQSSLISSVRAKNKERVLTAEQINSSMYFRASLRFLEDTDAFPNDHINRLASRIQELMAERKVQPFITAGDTMHVTEVETYPAGILVPFDFHKQIVKDPVLELVHVVQNLSRAVDRATGHADPEEMEMRAQAYGAEALLVFQSVMQDFRLPEEAGDALTAYPGGVSSLPANVLY